MNPILNETLLQYLKESEAETLALIEELAAIPAPSGKEARRADFCLQWLREAGAEQAYVDEALNVLCPVEGKTEDWILFSAHTDVVFPDEEPLPVRREGDYLYAPGVGDDTACLAMLLIVLRYVIRKGLRGRCGVLFAANSCEEGLGNLKGMREIVRAYGEKLRRAYTFDGQYDAVVNRCVGSYRYEVTVETEGGHSYNAFGNRNAILSAAELLLSLRDCEISAKGKGRTTFNVGTIEGGTSVNTIAQRAVFLYEFRSDVREDLEAMRRFFESRIEEAREKGLGEITVREVGVRPCGGDVDEAVLAEMTANAVAISERHSGLACAVRSGSTDCNIPMSVGIPAVCVGSYLGDGAHTREERMRIDSIPVGLRITAETVLQYFEEA